MTRRTDPAVLVLEDGSSYRGRAYGALGRTLGEVVFATGMTGYQETLTDPSYAGQIVVMTAPHIGNTGVNDEDPESSRIWVSGYVVRDPSRIVSNFRADGSLDDQLVRDGIVGHQRHRHAGRDPPHPGCGRDARRRLQRRGCRRSRSMNSSRSCAAAAEMAGQNLSGRRLDPASSTGCRRWGSGSARSRCWTSA